jgi:hypothetical protein
MFPFMECVSGDLTRKFLKLGLIQPAAAFGYAACCETVLLELTLGFSAADSPAFAEATADKQAAAVQGETYDVGLSKAALKAAELKVF